MDVKLHANATTTPKTRALIQCSDKPVRVLAGELGVSETTIRRWRGRDRVTDGSHRPKRMAISLSQIEERLVVELRTELWLGLDDLVEVMRRCVRASLSRSAIHRCLQRHGVAARPAAPPAAPGHFEATSFGFVHVDLKHLPRLDGQAGYVFVAIERLTRFVHVEIVGDRGGDTIAACLERFLGAFGHPVHTILSDNGAEFTDRFGAARWQGERSPSGNHPFDRVCASHGIAHRLTKPYHPQTNGMVERFNRRLAEALRDAPPTTRNAGKNRFISHPERNAFITTFVTAYNNTRLRCLNYNAPAQVLANLTGHNTFAGMTQWKCCRVRA